MHKSILNKTITLNTLRKELISLKKKFFIYETLQSEKEIKNKKINDPFRNGKEVIKHIK